MKKSSNALCIAEKSHIKQFKCLDLLSDFITIAYQVCKKIYSCG
jgi:hypothetical protein